MYKLSNQNLEIQINENPLEIRSLKWKGKEICYQQDGVWKKNWPFLFPIVGKLKDDKYKYDEKEYFMNQHGFFRNIDNFSIDEESDNLVNFSFTSNGIFKDIYPFEFQIKNQFEILDDSLIVTYEIINLDEKEMIFGLGHHPAFLVKKDGIISFEKSQNFTKKVDENGLISSKPDYDYHFKTIKVKELDFENGSFYFTQNFDSKWVSYEDDEITFEINTEDYEVFLLWSANNSSNFVCFEPWISVPDSSERTDNDFKNKSKMIKLSKDENYICEFKIKFTKG